MYVLITSKHIKIQSFYFPRLHSSIKHYNFIQLCRDFTCEIHGGRASEFGVYIAESIDDWSISCGEEIMVDGTRSGTMNSRASLTRTIAWISPFDSLAESSVPMDVDYSSDACKRWCVFPLDRHWAPQQMLHRRRQPSPYCHHGRNNKVN